MQIPQRGDRVRLIRLALDEPYAVGPGDEGEVIAANRIQILVDWDEGRRFHLVVGTDEWEIIS